MSNVSLSEVAKEILFQTIVDASLLKNKCFRLNDSDGFFELVMDDPQKDDFILKSGSVPILLVNKELDKCLRPLIIDIQRDRGKLKLIVCEVKRNANGGERGNL